MYTLFSAVSQVTRPTEVKELYEYLPVFMLLIVW